VRTPSARAHTLLTARPVSALPEPLPAPAGPLVAAALAELWPEDLAPAAYNSQYLQRHGAAGPAVLATARAAHVLGAPPEQVEETVFGVLGPDVALNVKARPRAPRTRSSAPNHALADSARGARVPARDRRAARGRVRGAVPRALCARDGVPARGRAGEAPPGGAGRAGDGGREGGDAGVEGVMVRCRSAGALNPKRGWPLAGMISECNWQLPPQRASLAVLDDQSALLARRDGDDECRQSWERGGGGRRHEPRAQKRRRCAACRRGQASHAQPSSEIAVVDPEYTLIPNGPKLSARAAKSPPQVFRFSLFEPANTLGSRSKDLLDTR
jgi:hypothetical protein